MMIRSVHFDAQLSSGRRTTALSGGRSHRRRRPLGAAPGLPSGGLARSGRWGASERTGVVVPSATQVIGAAPGRPNLDLCLRFPPSLRHGVQQLPARGQQLGRLWRLAPASRLSRYGATTGPHRFPGHFIRAAGSNRAPKTPHQSLRQAARWHPLARIGAIPRDETGPVTGALRRRDLLRRVHPH